ncbi:MAG: triple tyrosine motif-containing protein [Flavobacteriales bacterium]
MSGGYPEPIKFLGRERTEDPDSVRVWGGMSSKGAVRISIDPSLEQSRSELFNTTDGLGKGPTSIFRDPQGEGVLFGSGKKLMKYRNGRFEPTCRYGELYCKGEHQPYILKKGPNEEIWVNDTKGSPIKRLIPESEGYRMDSIPFRGLDLGNIRTMLPERERIWFGGDKGLACYFPDQKKEYDVPWECRIREVRGSNDSLLFGGTFSELTSKGTDSVRVPIREQPEGMHPVLPYAENRFFFEYAAAFPDRQEKVRYRYRLFGFDTAWSKPTKKTEKEYTNLPEGRYTFKVKAENVYGDTSSIASYRFRILPPWYRTWWAYGGYGAAGLTFVWLLVRLNGRRLRVQKERLERIVNERTREIREKNQALEEEKREVQHQKEKVEEAHQEITQSIDYAHKIQDALLQSEEPVSEHLPEHFILFKPQSQVSGDFYWGKEHKGHFYLAAIDCTGHGVPGAFMSMLGISQLNEIMNTDKVLTPGQILTDLRERVVRELSGSDPESTAKDGMDAAIVKIPIGNSNSNSNSKGGVEVEFAGAQNPLYVVRKGIVDEPPEVSMEYQGKAIEGDPVKPFKKSPDGIEIKGDGQPVGYDEYAKDAFTTVKLQLRKMDMLYFFSDGYADQFGGPKSKKFRYGPFKQLLASIHEKPLEEQKQELDRTFEDWKAEGQQEQIDDVVVIGLRL